MFNIYLAIYIVIGLIIVVGGAYKLNDMAGMVAAILFAIGALAVLILFGLNWFKQGDTPGSWPPTINTCPDYLTYYQRTMSDGSKQDSCVDTIGVSKNGSLKLFPKSGTPPTTDEFYFSLVSKSTDPNARNTELCQRAISMGLTWEGITNGESCLTPSSPNGGGGNGNGGGNCPPN